MFALSRVVGPLSVLVFVLALTGVPPAAGRALGPRQSSPWETGYQSTFRVSLSGTGEQGNGDSFSPSLSDDGRLVAFISNATNLVPGDANGNGDAFVHDTVAWQTAQVSYCADASEDRNLGAGDTFISGDGRYVAFAARASYVAPGGPMLCGTPGSIRGQECLFRRDLVTGDLVIADVRPDGLRGGSYGRWPSLSFDGRLQSFWSHSADLVAGDTNGASDVFVRDHIRQTTERVSVASDGGEADRPSGDFGFIGGDATALSRDGRYVVFGSVASDLVPGPAVPKADVFLRDRLTGTTERVSVSLTGGDGNDVSGLGARQVISDDGRFVVFASHASDLVPGDTNASMDIFVRDRTTATTERVSIASDGTEGDMNSRTLAVISADGRFVAFNSTATNLVPGDTNRVSDIFVRDRIAGRTVRVSVASTGAQANGDNGDGLWRGLSITPDGLTIAWSSWATNLVPGDTNGFPDIFVRKACDVPCPPYNPPWPVSPTPSPVPTVTRMPTVTATPTPTATATPTAVPTTTPATSCVCRIVRRQVPPAAVQDALANPGRVSGWGVPLNPNRPVGPFNPLRDCLSLQNVNVSYHPMFNGLVWKVGCP